MQLVTETNPDKQKILIIDSSTSPLQSLLKKELSKYDTAIFVSPHPLPTLNSFDVCYVIAEPFTVNKKIIHAATHCKVVFIFLNQQKNLSQTVKYIKENFSSKKKRIKCVSIESTHITDSDLEKILWFTYSDSSELLLTINTAPKKDDSPIPKLPEITSLKYAKKVHSKQKLFLWIALVFILVHIAFVPPLLAANALFYKLKDSASRDINSSIKLYKQAKSVLWISETMYNFVRPTYQLIGTAHTIDAVIQLDDSVALSFDKAVSLYNDADTFTKLLLKKNKTNGDIAFLESQKNKIGSDLDDLNQYIQIVIQNLPDWKRLEATKQSLKTASDTISTVQTLLPAFDSVFAKDSQKQYLLLFANNMELRPGGGFIGSFGILKVHNYTVEPPQIYDVYDADGQLTTHIDPPDAIRLYLQQPHWFLRDSAFSPDFPTNYNQAKVFLNEELKIPGFDGGILLTTTTIQNILQGMGNLYLPDFKETVNADNFYIKAQLYSESNFFPGSTQKKRFLGSVADQMVLKLDSVPQIKLLQMVKKSLQEKQMVVHFDDPKVQQSIDSLYWSGKLLSPQCPTTVKNCINNFIYPYEANLGVNKANFYVKKLVSVKSVIDKDGIVDTTLTVNLKNDSISNVFPGGIYKDYFQTILPETAIVKKVTKNNTLVDKYDLTDTGLKTLGVYMETPAQSATKLEIEYTVETGLDKGKGAYQFVVQKQIGSPNSEFHLEVYFPNNIHPTSQNFSPLVKHNEIIYNTTLTADKIFFIELTKD
jgi:hypothetical protein